MFHVVNFLDLDLIRSFLQSLCIKSWHTNVPRQKFKDGQSIQSKFLPANSMQQRRFDVDSFHSAPPSRASGFVLRRMLLPSKPREADCGIAVFHSSCKGIDRKYPELRVYLYINIHTYVYIYIYTLHMCIVKAYCVAILLHQVIQSKRHRIWRVWFKVQGPFGIAWNV